GGRRSLALRVALAGIAGVGGRRRRGGQEDERDEDPYHGSPPIRARARRPARDRPPERFAIAISARRAGAPAILARRRGPAQRARSRAAQAVGADAVTHRHRRRAALGRLVAPGAADDRRDERHGGGGGHVAWRKQAPCHARGGAGSPARRNRVRNASSASRRGGGSGTPATSVTLPSFAGR